MADISYNQNNEDTPLFNPANLPRKPDNSDVGSIDISIPGQRPYIVNFLSNVTFANQNEGEKVYMVARKHWFLNFGWVINTLFYSIIPIIVYLIINYFKFDLPFFGTKSYILVLLIYYSLLLTSVFRRYSEWFFNAFIISNERILEYKFSTSGSYSINELSLENIDDIKQTSGGFYGELLNFGDIAVFGEAAHTKIFFDDVPNPTLVRGVITELFKDVRKK